MSLFSGERVAVWGAARSGVAAANLLVSLGADVVLSDVRAESMTGPATGPVPGLDPRVDLRFGGNVIDGARFVVPSPGIMPSAAVFDAARRAGATIVGEIELAASVALAPIVAITGTDGKSTTTEMIGAMSRASGRPTVVAGNIGVPLSERVRDVGPDGLIVAEVSAFQLWSCGRFRPRVAVMTNLAADHIDYFGNDAAAYAQAKARVFVDQGEGDTAILRADDPGVMSMAIPRGVRRTTFGLLSEADWVVDADVIRRGREAVLRADELRVRGRHNLLNAASALAAGDALGLPFGPMLDALRTFEGLPHRMQHVRRLHGLTYIDDSKATNPHAARVGLLSLSSSYVAIVGGFDKGLDQSELVDELAARARAVVLIGGTAERTRLEIGVRLPVRVATTMEEAVVVATALAREGDAVVLSPAASSFDLYRDYHHRGQAFQDAVGQLSED